jgi:putative colanic acid biosynthesis acetyltransferase WcaF
MRGMGRAKGAARHVLQALFNAYGTHLPSRRLRIAWLRALGARIGPRTSVFMGVTVFGHRDLVIGARCVVAERCVLDARGGLTIDDDVVLAADVQLWTGSHDLASSTFTDRYAPIRIRRYGWLGTRSMVLGGVTMGHGAVAAAGAVVTGDVADFVVVGGVPAAPIGERSPDLDYDPTYRPFLL